MLCHALGTSVLPIPRSSQVLWIRTKSVFVFQGSGSVHTLYAIFFLLQENPYSRYTGKEMRIEGFGSGSVFQNHNFRIQFSILIPFFFNDRRGHVLLIFLIFFFYVIYFSKGSIHEGAEAAGPEGLQGVPGGLREGHVGGQRYEY